MKVVDLCEWCALARRLEIVNGPRFDELMRAMRVVVAREEELDDAVGAKRTRPPRTS